MEGRKERRQVRGKETGRREEGGGMEGKPYRQLNIHDEI